MIIKTYVANLAKYNEGILKGEWIIKNGYGVRVYL